MLETSEYHSRAEGPEEILNELNFTVDSDLVTRYTDCCLILNQFSEFLSDALLQIVGFLNKYKGAEQRNSMPPPSTPPYATSLWSELNLQIFLNCWTRAGLFCGSYRRPALQKCPTAIAFVDGNSLWRLLLCFKTLVDHFQVGLAVHLRPQRQLSDLPLKNFYRYTVNKLGFNEDGSLDTSSGVAVFHHLPQKRVRSPTGY